MLVFTVGEKIIGAKKMWNNYGAIQIVIFIAILDFSWLLSLRLSLFVVLRGDSKRFLLLFAIAFKSL